ncbi:unnamed protein product, partial [Didymodactylos carnosus]
TQQEQRVHVYLFKFGEAKVELDPGAVLNEQWLSAVGDYLLDML